MAPPSRLHPLPTAGGPVRGLAAGATLRDYAKAAGIAYETARWHLKRIYDKTETRALLLRTKATLGGESP